MKATSESSSNLGSPISMRDVLIRVWDQGYQSPHFRRSRFRPDGITFRITIACRQFPYSAAFTTNINWKKSRLEKFRMSYLRSTGGYSQGDPVRKTDGCARWSGTGLFVLDDDDLRPTYRSTVQQSGLGQARFSCRIALIRVAESTLTAIAYYQL